MPSIFRLLYYVVDIRHPLRQHIYGIEEDIHPSSTVYPLEVEVPHDVTCPRQLALVPVPTSPNVYTRVCAISRPLATAYELDPASFVERYGRFHLRSANLVVVVRVAQSVDGVLDAIHERQKQACRVWFAISVRKVDS